MADYNLRTFPYAGIAFPSEAPFFPIVDGIGTDNTVTVVFNQGYVFDYRTITEGIASKIKVSDMEQEFTVEPSDKFYVLVDYSGETIVASFDKNTAPPTEENKALVEVCTFDTNKALANVYLRENIHWNIGGDGETVLHPWKITSGTPVEEGVPSNWDVRGSTVYSNNSNLSIGNSSVSGNDGYIYLKVERNESSRAIISLNVEFAANLPSDDYTYQYIPLGYIEGSTIEQLAFEEIRIHELMIVDNGEFKLASFQLINTVVYSPPA